LPATPSAADVQQCFPFQYSELIKFGQEAEKCKKRRFLPFFTDFFDRIFTQKSFRLNSPSRIISLQPEFGRSGRIQPERKTLV
jgi:hypothetical protein